MTKSPVSWYLQGVGSRVVSEVRRWVSEMILWPGVVRAAVMPDAHLTGSPGKSGDDPPGCVGVVVGCSDWVYPLAVGSDIGCGMASVWIGAPHVDPTSPELRELLRRWQIVIPGHRHSSPQEGLPDLTALSDSALSSRIRRDAAHQFGTLGRGNHFLELQADVDRQLWITVHTGSRAVGHAVATHHGIDAKRAGSSAADTYLHDVALCRTYADLSRRRILRVAGEAAANLLGTGWIADSMVSCDHNHVQQELHEGESLWVHRKGCTPASDGEPGIIAGSMGTRTVLTLGRGCPDSLRSSSHGAGRAFTRGQARKSISVGELRRQMARVVYDPRHEEDLVEEAPGAYRDLRQVMKSQRDLTRTVAELVPLMVHKA